MKPHNDARLMNIYAVNFAEQASESQKRRDVSQVLKNKGLTEEEIAQFINVVDMENVMYFDYLDEHDLFPGNTPVDCLLVDLSFLSGKKRCQLLRLIYLAKELKKAKYSWLSHDEKYQLFLRGEVNFITMREQETLEKLMREVEHRATRWLATYIPNEKLEESEELRR
jgi:hypothetical protein